MYLCNVKSNILVHPREKQPVMDGYRKQSEGGGRRRRREVEKEGGRQSLRMSVWSGP